MHLKHQIHLSFDHTLISWWMVAIHLDSGIMLIKVHYNAKYSDKSIVHYFRIEIAWWHCN